MAAVIRGQYASGVPLFPSRIRYDDFAKGFPAEALQSHETLVFADTGSDPRIGDDVRAAWIETNIAAVVAVSLVKQGRTIAAFGLHAAVPREWTPLEIRLVEDVADRTWAAVERARAEAALREREERQTFLLTLGDAMRAQSSTNGLIEVAARLIGEHLAASRIMFTEFDEAKGVADIFHGWFADGAKPFPAVMPLEDYEGPILDALRAGRTVRIEDARDPTLARPDLAAIAELGVTALLSVPLIVGGRLMVNLSVHQHTARHWTDNDVALVQEVAERLWADLVRARAEAALRESEEQYRVLFESIDEGFCIIEVLFDQDEKPLDYRFLQVNPAFERQTGLVDAVGKTMRELAPQHERHWFDIYGRIALTGEPARFEDKAAALGHWYEVYAFRIGEPEQRQVAILFRDVMERKRAEEALRESEGRFRALASTGANAIYRMSPDWRQMYQLVGRDFLADTAEPIDNWEEGYILPEDRPTVFAAIEKAIRERALFELEHRVVRADGSVGWTRSRAVPLLGSDGEIVEWFGSASDVTEERRAEEARRESEERFRQFGDASSDVLWIRDAEKLQWEYLSPAFETIYGASRDEALSSSTLRNWLDLILPEDREHAVSNIRRVREGERVTFEYRVKRRSDGQIRWLRNTDFPMFDASGRVARIGGIGHDATEEKDAAERMHVLLAELQHRTRNLIAVVRGLADRTQKESASLDEFQPRFRERLAAISRVQGLLSRLDDGRRITFDELLREELRAHGASYGDSGRVTLDGPPGVPLRSGTVQTLALALHELATNAVKYGALSAPDGRLAVRWHVEASSGAPELHVEWRESGVDMPHDAAPQGGGYGRELIERALPYQLNARTSYQIGPDGVRCSIAVPILQETSHG